MNKIFFTVILWFQLCVVTSQCHAEAMITTSDMKWIPSEPKELEKQKSYLRWKEEFGKISKKGGKRFVADNINIRHNQIDVDNDGTNEILVQDTTWYSRGYGMGLFQKEGRSWKLISQHLGAFIFVTKQNSALELLLINRWGTDYTSFSLKYKGGKYRLSKEQDCIIGFNRFWELNRSRQENLASKASGYRPEEDPPVPRWRPECIAGDKFP